MKKIFGAGWFALFTAPLLFVFATVVIIPFFIGIGYSFFEWDGLPLNPMKWVGLSNYRAILQDERFINSAIHTVVFTAISVVSINILGMAFALVCTSKLKTGNAARAMLFAPYMIGGLILGYIWKFILGEGMKAVGEATGLTGVFFNWLIQPHTALMAMAIVTTWQTAGYIMIIYITGIMSIPDEVIEAASIDGAGFWSTLMRIKFPLIMQSFTICLFMTLSNCFKLYDVNYSLTAGGPYSSTELFAMSIYNQIFSLSRYGYGQAEAIIFFIVVAAITLVQVSATKKREVEL
jgi:raffinose/stachyose/melibiose transport system permease protein